MANTGLQSIADLTASTCITTGEIPPPLVGSSTTVIGTRLYLFAGRLVSTRRMTNDLYVLDLESFVWTRIEDSDQRAPEARYFHSANHYKNSIVFFGGMGYARTTNEGLSVLDDVAIFDLDTYTWNYPEITPSSTPPLPRYAHLASVTANKLVVVGGQDMTNVYIEDINVLDLDEMTWISSRSFEKHCGAYRSVAVSSTNHTNLPLFGNSLVDNISLTSYEESTSSPPTEPLPQPRKSSSSQSLGSGGPGSDIVPNSRQPPSVNTFGNRVPPRRASVGQNVVRPRSIRRIQSASGNAFCRLSYTMNVTEENPNPIYLYSNYNFTDVKRELQVIAPPTTSNYQIMDHSNNMTGAFLPPGLRFPTGAILGHHLIISGTYLTNTHQTFSIWALNLANLVWTRIDTGSCFMEGSWNRGVLCEETNKYIVLGHRDRSLVDDYNHRQTNFDHVTVVDLEAFGVYQPPPATMSTIAQELGLALLNDKNNSDFEIVTLDEQRIPVNSHMLCERWPHFRSLVEQQAYRMCELNYDESVQDPEEERTLLMFKNRALEFPEPFPVTLAFLQYLYTDHLLTSQQHQPHILAQLLLLADMYDLDRLRQLATHALHQTLSMATAALIYETAALSRQTGLQIRALKVMIAAKKMLQQQQRDQTQQQVAPHGVPPGDQMIRRGSLPEQDTGASQWPLPQTPTSLPASAAALPGDIRASYFDVLVPSQLNSQSANPPTVTGRARSSSSASALGTTQSRSYLPTIQDSGAEDYDDDEFSAMTSHRLRTTRSNGSLRSMRSSNRSLFTPGTAYGSSSQTQQQESSFGFVSGGLTGVGF